MARLTPELTPTPAILCCGEAVIDRMRDTSGKVRDFPGGGAINSAVALQRLETPAGFLGALSTDAPGVALHNYLIKETVDTRFAVRSARPSTIATITHGPSGPSFDFADMNSAGRLLSYDDLPAIPAATSALLFGGISLIADPCGAAFETLMAQNAATRLIYLDLNIRPALIQSPAPYRARLLRMILQADIVKVSDEDLEFLDPRAHVSRQTLVVHTRGAGGVDATLHGSVLSISAPQVAVVDTLGAGDIFNAGMLSALFRQNRAQKSGFKTCSQADLAAALGFATRAASFSVTRTGAQGPTLKELPCAP
jgi:fructokinase